MQCIKHFKNEYVFNENDDETRKQNMRSLSTACVATFLAKFFGKLRLLDNMPAAPPVVYFSV